ncbi:hypothetical protein CPB83DRAFT_839685 [Crepidotus variabilis]|uniref:Uncharacterized protein n=1 Tax=Crepidotus variabilis TaxID=179855 RepID=A0A9P6JJN1_9AGAR|nr:hypothetical protein CPB83DRAFT_839685 [Crepidotus variabilis]
MAFVQCLPACIQFCPASQNSTLLETNKLIEAMVPGRTWTGDILVVRAAAKDSINGVVHLCPNDDILINFAVERLVERMTRGTRLSIPVHPVFPSPPYRPQIDSLRDSQFRMTTSASTPSCSCSNSLYFIQSSFGLFSSVFVNTRIQVLLNPILTRQWRKNIERKLVYC